MVFWGAAAAATAALAAKREQLLSAERKLVQLMLERTTKDAAATSFEPYDTPIPFDCIPIASSNLSWCRRGDEEDEDLTIHGIQVTNERLEKSDQKTKPLVLLHGYMNGGAYFYRNLVGLSRYFSKIHALDLLGWGLSSRPSMNSLQVGSESDEVTTTEDFFVESLEAWRKQNSIDSMILAGHSMGGYIGVAYAERYPERVERLILISPVGVPKETEAEHQRRRERYLSNYRSRMFYALYANLFERNYTGGGLLRSVSESRGRGWINSYVTRRLPAISDPHEQELLTDYLYHNNTLPGSGEYCISRLLKPSVFGRKPLQHRIPKLQVKSCSFLYGADDWMDSRGGLLVQEGCAHRQKQGLATPAVNVYEVSHAGHLLMLENYRQFNHGVVLSAGLGDQLPFNVPLPSKLKLGVSTLHSNDTTSDETQSESSPNVGIQVSAS